MWLELQLIWVVYVWLQVTVCLPYLQLEQLFMVSELYIREKERQLQREKKQ